MQPCRYWTGDRCRLGRFGGRPDQATCRLCQARGDDRVKGAGDLVHLAVEPAAKAIPRVRDGKCGCSGRQRRLNDLLPIGRR